MKTFDIPVPVTSFDTLSLFKKNPPTIQFILAQDDYIAKVCLSIVLDIFFRYYDGTR